MSELSIIVPVYNVEKQLKICLDSIVNQSYNDIEIIVIDDASTDNSAAIIDEYTKKYSNVIPKYLSHNIGVGNVRNLGVEMVQSPYIGFVDSDDWIDSDFYQILVSAIKKDDSDIAICGIKTEYKNFYSSQLRYKYSYPNCITGAYALKLLTKSEDFNCYITPIVNNKIYRRNFLKQHDIKFNSNRSFQDDFFSFFAILYATKISLVPDIYYHYYQNDNSITHTFSEMLVDNCFDTLLQIRYVLERQNIFLIYEKEYYSFVERCITSLLSMLFKKEPNIIIQKKYLCYILEKLFANFNINKMIDYLDNTRIFEFWNVR